MKINEIDEIIIDDELIYFISKDGKKEKYKRKFDIQSFIDTLIYNSIITLEQVKILGKEDSKVK